MARWLVGQVGVVALAAGLAGCVAHRANTRVQVSAKLEYARPEAEGRRYVLLPVTDDGLSDAESPFLRVADYVDRALQAAGYTLASCPRGTRNCAAADLAIFVDYQYGDRAKVQLSPWFGYPTGYYGLWGGYPYGWGWRGRYWRGPFYGPPQGAYVAEYSAQLSLSALDLKRERAAEAPLRPWYLVMQTWVDYDDIEVIVPALLAAGAPHIGADTGAVIRVDVAATDRQLCELAGRTDCAALPAAEAQPAE